MDHTHLHARARQGGVNPIVYWLMRAWLQPFAHLYWRLSRIGREHIPAVGPGDLRLQPSVVPRSVHRRPLQPPARLLRGQGGAVQAPASSAGSSARSARSRSAAAPRDADMIETAKAILKRGDPVLIFPEGTRTRPGALGKPKRGVGRLALETGATVVPVAMIGTEAIRKGIRIRPNKIRVRIGAPLQFPQVDEATSQLAAAVTDRIWPNVMLQWEWLGGLPPLRRAAVIGGGSWGTAIAVALARAGIDVDLGCRTRAQADLMAATRAPTTTTCPASTCPERVRPMRAADLELGRHDLVAFAVPAAELPAVARRARRRDRAAHRRARALQGPRAAARDAPERVRRRAHAAPGPSACSAARPTPPRRSTAARRWCSPRTIAAFARQVSDALAGRPAAGQPHHRRDRRRAGRLREERGRARRRRGRPRRPERRRARRPARCSPRSTPTRAASGSRPETFAGLAGTGDLVATVLAEGSRNRRAGELLAQGVPAAEIGAALGQTAEAVAAVPLLAARLKAGRRRRAGAARARGDHRGQRRARALDRVADGAETQPQGREGKSGLGGVVSAPHGHSSGQGQARCRLLRALQGAPEGRLLVLVLPGGQPPRRRGPDRADVPAGVPALRARPEGVPGPPAAAVADPDRPQPRGQLLPRPLAPAADQHRRRGRDLHAAHHRGPGARIATTWRASCGASSSCRTTAGRR